MLENLNRKHGLILDGDERFLFGETSPYIDEKLIILPFTLSLEYSLHTENNVVKFILI